MNTKLKSQKASQTEKNETIQRHIKISITERFVGAEKTSLLLLCSRVECFVCKKV